jgi:hypothetical protein
MFAEGFVHPVLHTCCDSIFPMKKRKTSPLPQLEEKTKKVKSPPVKTQGKAFDAEKKVKNAPIKTQVRAFDAKGCLTRLGQHLESTCVPLLQALHSDDLGRLWPKLHSNEACITSTLTIRFKCVSLLPNDMVYQRTWIRGENDRYSYTDWKIKDHMEPPIDLPVCVGGFYHRSPNLFRHCFEWTRMEDPRDKKGSEEEEGNKMLKKLQSSPFCYFFGDEMMDLFIEEVDAKLPDETAGWLLQLEKFVEDAALAICCKQDERYSFQCDLMCRFWFPSDEKVDVKLAQLPAVGDNVSLSSGVEGRVFARGSQEYLIKYASTKESGGERESVECVTVRFEFPLSVKN